MQYNRGSLTALQAMTDVPIRPRRPAAAHGRHAVWLIVIVFLLQFLGATQHHHEPKAKAQHCVACALHAQPHAAPPGTTLAPLPSGWILLHALVRTEAGRAPAIEADYLLPPAHGPPAFQST